MAGVLHLYELESDCQTQRGVAHLCANPLPGVRCVGRTIGHGGDFRHVPDAMVRLRRIQNGGIDIIHAWGARALTAAALGTAAKIIYSPAPRMNYASFRWLHSIVRHRPVQIVCPTATLRRDLIEHGVAAAHCHVIRPGVDISRLPTRNPRLRAQMGSAEDDYVLLTVGESTHAAGHHLALWAAGILNVLNHHTRVLVWGRGVSASSIDRYARRILQNGTYACAAKQVAGNVEFEELTTVADAALVTALGAVATWPVAICMAAAMPIVATATPSITELLEDGRTSLMVAKAQPRDIAERVIDLQRDRELACRIGDNARADACRFLSLKGFLEQWHTTYRQVLAGNAVELTDPMEQATPVAAS